jgi:hypothetical protein
MIAEVVGVTGGLTHPLIPRHQSLDMCRVGMCQRRSGGYSRFTARSHPV